MRLLAERFVPPREGKGDEALGPFVRRRFGKEAFDRLVQPLISGIYTADPEKLSLAATFPRFLEMEAASGSLLRASKRSRGSGGQIDSHASGARYNLFVGFRRGMEQLFTRLREEVLRRAVAHVGRSVISIEREPDGWRLGTDADGGTAFRFDAVILACPAYVAARLLAGVDGGLSQRLAEIEYASSAIVVTAHPASSIREPLNAFGLVIPTIEKRDLLAVSFASQKFPGRAPAGRVLLRSFLGGALRPEMIDRSDDELREIVGRELRSILGVSGPPEFSIVTRYERAMPQYHLGHLDRVRGIEAAVAGLPGLELTGSAYRGVGIPDVVADAERAATAIVSSLS